MSVICPNCKEELDLPCEVSEGQHILCPCCSVKFEFVPKKTTCPNCKEELILPQGVEEGQHIRCPYCEEKFSYCLQHTSLEGRPANGDDTANVKKRAERRLSKQVWLISACVAVVVVFCCCLLCKSSTQKIAVEKKRGTDKVDIQFTDGNNKEGQKERHGNDALEEIKKAEAATSHYVSNESLEIDLGKCADLDGALGFKWGEKPRSKKYKVPCEVEYPSPFALFTKMSLDYDSDGGLIQISFSAPQFVVWPDVSNLPKEFQQRAMDDFLKNSILPALQPLKEEAERILRQEVPCACFDASFLKAGIDKIVGVTGNTSNGCFGGLRMDLRGENPEQVFFIQRVNKTDK